MRSSVEAQNDKKGETAGMPRVRKLSQVVP